MQNDALRHERCGLSHSMQNDALKHEKCQLSHSMHNEALRHERCVLSHSMQNDALRHERCGLSHSMQNDALSQNLQTKTFERGRVQVISGKAREGMKQPMLGLGLGRKKYSES